MPESIDDLAPNGVRKQDVAVLITLLAELEGELMAGQLPDYLAARLKHRFVKVGLLDESGSSRDLRQAINDLNHRLRYSYGSYAEPIAQVPVPD